MCGAGVGAGLKGAVPRPPNSRLGAIKTKRPSHRLANAFITGERDRIEGGLASNLIPYIWHSFF